MPVMVIGAQTPLGATVVRRLLATGGQVRVYLDPDEVGTETLERFRALGCKVARGAADDEGRLEMACEQVHTVVHAADALTDAPEVVVDRLALVASAATGANVRRIVWPSWMGAGEPGDDGWLRACAQAEELLADLPFESVAIRRGVTCAADDPVTAALAQAPPLGAARSRHAPLWAEDLAEAVATADRARGEGEVTHVVVEMAGPAVLNLQELTEALRRHGVEPQPATLPPHAVAYLARGAEPGSKALRGWSPIG